jgi:hypothetical protein
LVALLVVFERVDEVSWLRRVVELRKSELTYAGHLGNSHFNSD